MGPVFDMGIPRFQQFDRVGLRTTIGKMVGIFFLHCWAEGTQSETAYEQWMMGEGLTYRDRYKVRVKCLGCGDETMVGSLAVRQHTQYGREAGSRHQ